MNKLSKNNVKLINNKIVPLFLCAVLMSACLLMALTGCENKRERFEEGDFIYEVWDQKDGELVSKIVQLSDAGKSKEILVIPETLGGYKVTSFSYEYGLGIREIIHGENVKRIYCPYKVYFPKLILNNFEKLEKILLFKGGDVNTHCVAYSPYNAENYLANVVYHYNYLDNEEEDCYWIDDYDYGTKIAFIPPQPTREGYTFAGWYKEKECINKWDFATDKLPTAITNNDSLNDNKDAENVTPDQGALFQLTKLYAKWIKN